MILNHLQKVKRKIHQCLRGVYAVPLLLIGCSTPSIVQEEHVIPPQVETFAAETTMYFIPSPCDTAGILQSYLNLRSYGGRDGLSYTSSIQAAKDTVLKYVDRLVVKWRTELKRDTLKIRDTDTVTVVQEYGFWKKAELSLASIGLFVLVVGLVYLLTRLRVI